MRTRAAVLLAIVTGLLAYAPAAFAYNETTRTIDPRQVFRGGVLGGQYVWDCTLCHGYTIVSPGPHGNYTLTSRRCNVCHGVHNAWEEGFLLLPANTIVDNCEVCHDGTGGKGVYGTIEARGLTVESAHRRNGTNEIPGGELSTGGTRTADFWGEGGNLACSDCHSVHGSDTVSGFTPDRPRVEEGTRTIGRRARNLLRRQPNGGQYRTDIYGSDWCASCHRAMASTMPLGYFNHPVDASPAPGYFYYENVVRVTSAGTSLTALGSLGANNGGYVMPWFGKTPSQGGTRAVDQRNHYPICQQCHEDARHVGDYVQCTIVASETFRVRAVDGNIATDNPRFQVFPHESQDPALMVEQGDDLCRNCHSDAQLGQ